MISKKSLVTMARTLLRNKKYNRSDCREERNSEFETSVKERKKEKESWSDSYFAIKKDHLNIFT